MSAIFAGENDEWRLRLEREIDSLGGPVAALIGVNPSTANAVLNDQTIRKDMGFARVHGWSRIIKGNKFAFRATDARELRRAVDPVGPGNDEQLEQIMHDADVIVPCWGPLTKLPRHLRERWRAVVAIADRLGKPLHCFGTTNDGQPRHTLTLAYATPLTEWRRPS